MGLRRLLFGGTGLTDYQDVLTRERWKSQVSEAGGELSSKWTAGKWWTCSSCARRSPPGAFFKGWPPNLRLARQLPGDRRQALGRVAYVLKQERTSAV